MTAPKNRYDLAELAGAFGDLGTLIPFVAAYISVVKMDPAGILLAFGSMMVIVGLVYRTPFPVQPMKAIGAAAITQTGALASLTAATVMGAGIVTGLIWLLLAATGMARRLTRWVPKAALLGVVMGLGFSFMLEGTRMMAQSPWLGAALLAATLVLLARSRIPAMLVLLVVGGLVAVLEQPALLSELSAIRVAPRLPSFAWPGLTLDDLWIGAIFLALPQLPLTFGNALIAITEENNRLFPDRPVTERRVAFSTGLMNLWSSAIGGIPMCHGAGGMAGHVQFGARTGGATVMLGALLLAMGLLLADSVALIFRLFPPAVLGVILFLAGVQLALASKDVGGEKIERFVVLATAALAVWNVGIAVVFGILAFHAAKRGWIGV
ncbi:putative sulfate/molybdate transporter [Sulfurisoma sediminicola]|uniref:MFS superfamily molybdate transporter n=1 Tax=Sulfurisoma sediminicola TaxID=1381557 RepID=A0A497XDU8_9PROT|nr:putative sulfate/molybdate transporter [Sulfurisoma sediminicola]RLJ65182.1 MFS superfamily molybdate transporter [Sulfurisoma sediminicola]